MTPSHQPYKQEWTHVSPERQSNPSRWRQLQAGAVLSAAAVLVGCSSDKADEPSVANMPPPAAAEEPMPEQLVEVPADELWAEAVIDFRERVTNGQSVEVFVAREQCIYWPTTDNQQQLAYTLVEDPIMYTYEVDESRQVAFLPFVQSQPNGNAQIMNGPFLYMQQDDRAGDTVFGNLDVVIMVGTIDFQPQRLGGIRAELDEELPAGGYLAVADGEPVGRTSIVSAQQLQEMIAQRCQPDDTRRYYT